MDGSVEACVVVWSRYITLKLFWRTLETWPDIRNLVFVINEENKFPKILKVCQRWALQIKYKTGITLNPDLTSTCNYF